MNCRQAQPQLYSEPDGTLAPAQRAALEAHLAQCPACQKIRATLVAVLTAWRTEATQAEAPDAEREWHAVRRRLRGGDVTATARPAHGRRNVWPWLALPLGAGAAVAIALFVSPDTPPAAQSDAEASPIARANSVEAPGNNASTTVFVDDKSGWLIVWASDGNPKRG